MKKIFTSLCILLAGLSAHALDIQIKGFGGAETYKDGDTVICGITESYGGGMNMYNPELTVYVNTTTTIKSTATLLENVTPAPMFCGGGLCQTLEYNVPVTKTATVTPEEPLDLQLDVLMGTVEKKTPVSLAVSAGDQVVNLTVVFVPGEHGAINAVEAKNIISVSGRTLCYSVDTPTDITLYTISGQSAITRSISGTGTLSLQGLPSGVYIYRTAQRTGKIIVK